MSVYFISDLHLGHDLAREKRGFDTLADHDQAVIDSLSGIKKREKLFILGDVAFKLESLNLLGSLRCTIDIILGNHDQFKIKYYMEYANNIYGVLKYNKFLLTHIPVHPQELYRCIGNIHGHIHKNAVTQPLKDPRYINVNWDYAQEPISFEVIKNSLK